MTRFLVAAVFLAAVQLPAVSLAASSTQEQVALCAAALDAKGIASASDYRAKFNGIRGGGAKKLSVTMIPTTSGKEPIQAVCTIKRGRVIAIAVNGGKAMPV